MNSRPDASLPETGRSTDQSADSRAIEFDLQAGFGFLFNATPTPILVLDRETLRFIAVNDAALAFYGYSRPEFSDLRLPDIRPEKMPGEIEGMIARFDDPSLPDVPRLHLTKSGDHRIVKVNARLFDVEGRPAILAAVFDMTKQYEAERELRRVRSFLKNLVDHVPTAVFAKDDETGQFIFYNSAAESLFGLPQEQVIGQTSIDLFGSKVAAELLDQDEKARESGKSVHEHTLLDAHGNQRIVRIRKVVIGDDDVQEKKYVLAVAEDVTEERVREARICHLASHDTLTGLANRWMFQQQLDSTSHLDDASESCFAIHYIDLDGFKAANDAWGHPVGDEILKLAAQRMLRIVRSGDIVARLGGDEFAVLQLSVNRSSDAKALADRLVGALSEPYLVGGRQCEVGASVGICVAEPRSSVDHVIEEADRALYEAKRQGKGRFVCRSIREHKFEPTGNDIPSAMTADIC